VLVREDIDVQPEADGRPEDTTAKADAVIAAAGGAESSRGKRLIELVAAGERNGLYVRPYTWSFMLTPQQKRTRCLFVFGRWNGGEEIALAYYADAIAEFFPIEAESVRSIMGPDAVKVPIPDEATAHAWARRIDELFEAIASAGRSADEGSDRNAPHSTVEASL
jgi:hypothetical protein